MIMNEKIKADEVQLTGVNGEDLGIVSTREALRMAKELKVDLICLSLSSSPPPCQLVKQSDYKAQMEKEKQKNRKQENAKIKEIRLSAFIEQHDYDTKKRQAERILTAQNAVQLTVRLDRKESQAAKELIEQLIRDLAHCGKQEKGIQISGKQVVAIVRPI